MASSGSRRLIGLGLLLGLAFALRIYRLDAVPLRGDEAFAVRYWAASPADVMSDLAHWEPHPFGAFFSFWAWKHLAGSSEFAMRYLPALVNLVGLASTAALGWRLWRSTAAAVLLAALWAINPFQIWHAQDVRNYALWAGLSPLALLLFLRAANTNHLRNWALYLLVEATAAYLFFLEPFLFIVQALYLLAFRRNRSTLRRAALAWGALGLILVPWLIQVIWLANSGYAGTLGRADPPQLLIRFLPTLLIGDRFPAPWGTLAPLGWCALVILGSATQPAPRRRIALWLAAWIAIPTALLLIVATRMNVFDPRYLITITPALLLLVAGIISSPEGVQHNNLRRGIITVAGLTLLVMFLPGLDHLRGYFRGDQPKAPHWPALVAYLDTRTGPHDLILHTTPDPAFNYYYRGPSSETSLEPGGDAAAQARKLWPSYHVIWLVGRSPTVEAALAENGQKLSFDQIADFTVTQYRSWAVNPSEITVPLDVRFGDVAWLAGYTLQGPDPTTGALTALLYWEPLSVSQTEYTVFFHLAGPPRPSDDSPLWDQDDHPPLHGSASTHTWQPGGLLRDAYQVLGASGPRLVPGTYTLLVGFYDPVTNIRLPVTDAAGTPLGDSYALASFTWPLPK